MKSGFSLMVQRVIELNRYWVFGVGYSVLGIRICEVIKSQPDDK